MKAKRFTEEQIIGGIEGSGSRSKDEGAVPSAWDIGSDLLQLEGEVFGHDCI